MLLDDEESDVTLKKTRVEELIEQDSKATRQKLSILCLDSGCFLCAGLSSGSMGGHSGVQVEAA